jgi:DNA-directed RNA polymerase delta subunit.
MDASNKTALELLEQLRSERAELDILIRGLEKRLGIVTSPDDSDLNHSPTPRVTVSIDSIPVGFFHNLSQAAAAEKLLRMNEGHPLTTNEIMDAFRKSGMDVSGKNAITILYNALKRSPKFERVAGKAWGMAEWYPQSRRKKEQNEEDSSEDES